MEQKGVKAWIYQHICTINAAVLEHSTTTTTTTTTTTNAVFEHSTTIHITTTVLQLIQYYTTERNFPRWYYSYIAYSRIEHGTTVAW